jgi:hypothetical protein
VVTDGNRTAFAWRRFPVGNSLGAGTIVNTSEGTRGSLPGARELLVGQFSLGGRIVLDRIHVAAQVAGQSGLGISETGSSMPSTKLISCPSGLTVVLVDLSALQLG